MRGWRRWSSPPGGGVVGRYADDQYHETDPLDTRDSAFGLVMFCSTDHKRVLGAHLARARFGAFDNMRDGFKLVEILPDGVLGVQADLARVRAHEAAQEDPPGQHVSPVGLDRLENGDRDLRGLREPIEGEPTSLFRSRSAAPTSMASGCEPPSYILPHGPDRRRLLARFVGDSLLARSIPFS